MAKAPAAPAPQAKGIASTTPLQAAAKSGLVNPALLVKAPASQVASTAPVKSTGVAANTANFLDASSAPLAPVAVKAPVKTAAQLASEAAAAKAHAADVAKAQANATAQQNQQYLQQRADDAARQQATHERLLATDPQYAALEKFTSEARVDWGLLPAAGAILGGAAAVVATGGAAAAALAVPVTASTAAGTVAAVGGAAVAADRLLAAVSGKEPSLAAKADAVIKTTAQLAEAGSIDAQAGVDVLNAVAADRVKNLVPAGVPQALSDAGEKAFGEYQKVVATAPAVVTPPAVKLAAPAKRPVAVAAPKAAPKAAPASSGVLNPLADLATAQRRTVSVSVPKGGSNVAPRVAKWLVSDAGHVYSAAEAASLRGVSGWVVFGDGKVERAA